MKKIKSGSPEEFVRLDSNPGAVVNVNDHALEQYKQIRSRLYDNLNKINEINTIKEENLKLKEEMADIKSMLAQLLEKVK